MRFAHVLHPAATEPRLVLVREDDAVYVDELFPGAPTRLSELVAGGDDVLARIAAAAPAAPATSLEGVAFASAVDDPPVILAVGLNYAAHSGELGLKTDATPTVFVLWPNSLAGHEQTTSWPRSLSESVDYEAELGVIIGRHAKDVAAADALDHVWGYTVVNDITARDIQFSEAQWSRCKSFDGFTPTGPYAVTRDEIPDPQDLHIWTIVDGTTVQDASTGQMVRSVATLIAQLSQSVTLLPGTLISTGSPGGAGYSRDPQIFLRDRSTVTVGIDGIGALTTHCRMTD
ncbi:MAG: 2-hydroxyhepta-2,4-diene-1,7-dioate isomerase [Microbacterium sp.]|jgi:2-keto-4-pentenoate hydratase/2-oxohepta-3-ene-1,7-dioic acid hydratase in catechol pathway|uniref:2-hydroxyhepta-2,4-diene-1,7-dioate isomerase n=1 Tax=Microbacterium ginsengisoli TaxID=400772 RepID=A0A0F0M339_9MICO|nr:MULTISPECIES: fumarylacetoacetate hydrolase family protein [Microbacterium]MAL07814.1 2-hydroxyhepta-2,4-diene-1,7-dioate isomerase [Microbacterium sp.]KJL41390.1 Ureidoglycolate lyase [Microbacterium ginsengisoli]KQR92311.1 2-hydroxyhepta-2,4-diene-1,7-dioate isomerase [Microbacterium sp. Leaf351]KQR92838.1 2-hydroxyhepta-2,4-diene-1,7-dioate isomerase [Microbacterium sp. Leaf347]MBN9198922.1 fumarylacetoacetate hydrolase family protein [Microbacterium ginsengisoli]